MPRFGLDTKTYRLTDRQSQCDFDFDFDFDKPLGTVCISVTNHDTPSLQKLQIRHNLCIKRAQGGRMLKLWMNCTINRLEHFCISETNHDTRSLQKPYRYSTTSYLHVKWHSLTAKRPPTYTGHWCLRLSRGSWSNNGLAVMVILLDTYLDRSRAECWVMRADTISACVTLRYALTSRVRHSELPLNTATTRF
jgi:hypothetical protein